MGLETGVTYIEDLNELWPLGSDNPNTLDNHDRLIKAAVKGSFPNLGAAAVTKTAAELNSVVTNTDAKVLYNRKELSIGPWDMDTTAAVSVAHGLTLSKIRAVAVTIIEDGQLEMHSFPSHDYSASASGGHRVYWDATNIYIQRTTGGYFDTVDFNNSVINRGYVVIDYTD